MKALTSEQQRILAALIEFAGGNAPFQRALCSGGAETPFKELLDRIRLLREGRRPSRGFPPTLTE
jgi:hypothetical protein